MNTENVTANNRVYLAGSVATKPVYSHELFGEGFYELLLNIPRLSSQSDLIPLTVSERLLVDCPVEIGKKLALNGQFRSYNKIIDDRSKLMLTVFVRDFCESEGDNPNLVELSGYICKAPVYRTTPFNREICDILLAVNRAYGKSDYIPCIAWGRNARFVRAVDIGQRISVSGRIQSREYIKKLGEEVSETRVAYELSINKISMVDEAEADETAGEP